MAKRRSGDEPKVPDRLTIGPPKPVKDMTEDEFDAWCGNAAELVTTFLFGKIAQHDRAQKEASS